MGRLGDEQQFVPYQYPAPGQSRPHMIYQYGASPSSARQWIAPASSKCIATPSVDLVVSQAIWQEGETQFADIILPACTVAGNMTSAGVRLRGLCHHNQNQTNHRMVVMQHKCIEPLGESKSDYRIFGPIFSRVSALARCSPKDVTSSTTGAGGCSDPRISPPI